MIKDMNLLKTQMMKKQLIINNCKKEQKKWKELGKK